MLFHRPRAQTASSGMGPHQSLPGWASLTLSLCLTESVLREGSKTCDAAAVGRHGMVAHEGGAHGSCPHGAACSCTQAAGAQSAWQHRSPPQAGPPRQTRRQVLGVHPSHSPPPPCPGPRPLHGSRRRPMAPPLHPKAQERLPALHVQGASHHGRALLPQRMWRRGWPRPQRRRWRHQPPQQQQGEGALSAAVVTGACCAHTWPLAVSATPRCATPCACPPAASPVPPPHPRACLPSSSSS